MREQHRHRHVKTETEIGVMQSLQEMLSLEVRRRGAGDRFSLRALRGTNPANTLILDFYPPELCDHKLAFS